MAQRYNENDQVKLGVEKKFSNPSQTLTVGSAGTVLKLMSDGSRYRIQFDARSKTSIISDSDLQ